MKKKEKRMIMILVAITVIAIIALFMMKGKENKAEENTAPKEEFVNVLEDGTRLNTSDKLHEMKKFEGLEITDFQLTEKGEVTLLLGTITNTTQTTQGGFPVDIKVVDKQGNQIAKVGLFLPPVEPGESAQLSTNATANFANAYDFSISRK